MSEFFEFLRTSDPRAISLTITFVSIVLFLLLITLFTILKKLLLSGIEYIKFGKFELHGKNLKKHNKYIDMTGLLEMFDIIIASELDSLVQMSIMYTNEINRIEMDYERRLELLFNNTLIQIMSDFRSEMSTKIKEKLNFNDKKIADTREYFLVTEVLDEYKTLWYTKTKDIVKRNGFLRFLDDRKYCQEYVEEYKFLFLNAININKLIHTELCQKDFEDVMSLSEKDNVYLLEKMFMSAALLKKEMITKREDKLEYIRKKVTKCTTDIIEKLKDKIMSSNPENIELYHDKKDSDEKD